MKILLVTLPLIMLLTTPQCAMAQDIDVTRMPGYVDLEAIEIPVDAEEVVDIDLGPDLIHVALGVDEAQDSRVLEALDKIKSIRVKSFELDDDDADLFRREVEDIQKQLNTKGWKRMIFMKDGEEMVSVNAIHDDKTIVGLMVMVFEPGDTATFVNIVGEINFSTLMGLAKEVGDVDIEELMEQIEESQEEDSDDEI